MPNLAPADALIQQQANQDVAQTLGSLSNLPELDLSGLRGLLGRVSTGSAPRLQHNAATPEAGFGNAINNFLQLRAFNQRQGLGQQQLDMQRDVLARRQLEAEAKATRQAEISHTIGQVYGPQAQLLYELNPDNLDPVLEAEAKGLAFDRTAGELSQDGIPQPQNVNRQRFITGDNPLTQQQVEADELSNQLNRQAVQKGQLELGALPTELSQQVRKAEAAIAGQELQNQIDAIKKSFQPIKQELEVQGASLANEKVRQQVKKNDEAEAFFDQLGESFKKKTIDLTDPQTQRGITLGAARFGQKLNLPNSKFEARFPSSGAFKNKTVIIEKNEGGIPRIGVLENGQVKWQN